MYAHAGAKTVPEFIRIKKLNDLATEHWSNTSNNAGSSGAAATTLHTGATAETNRRAALLSAHSQTTAEVPNNTEELRGTEAPSKRATAVTTHHRRKLPDHTEAARWEIEYQPAAKKRGRPTGPTGWL